MYKFILFLETRPQYTVQAGLKLSKIYQPLPLSILRLKVYATLPGLHLFIYFEKGFHIVAQAL